MEDPVLLKKKKENPGKIPSAVFIEKIEEYFKKYNAETVFKQLQELYR